MAIDVRGLAPLLEVFDMPTSIKFYCDGLGFEIVATDGKPSPNFHWVLLRLNGSELMLNTAYDEGRRPTVPDPARIDAHRDVGIYFACPHLRRNGINTKEPRVAPYGMKQLYLNDPDGYVLCFQWKAEALARR